MRIIYFGTPDIAVPCLERLIAGRFEVVGVVSQPDRRRGRGRKLSPSPVAQLAIDADIPLLRPEKVGEPEVVEAMRAWQPDIGVVLAFGQFIPKAVRELPSAGFLINAHASLLPKLRGAAPIARAILTGETVTGVSVMRVDREMDAGPVALTRTLEIGADENTEELSARIARLAADCIEEALEQLDAGTLAFVDQDARLATEAPKLGREDGRLDWSRPARELVLRIRALAPKPGAFTTHGDETLRILAARAEPDRCDAEPGTLELMGKDGLRIATGEGWLVPLRVQRSGGKAMDVAAFLRGRAIDASLRLGQAVPSREEPRD